MIKVIVAGDFVPRRRTAVQIETGNYSCLENVKSVIQSVDYAIVNFESPVVLREAKPVDKTGPNLKCTEKAMECVAQAGFHCVTLANNHFRDQGQIGVEDTLATCRKYNIDYVGGGKNLEEAKRILYKEINDKCLAIINVCEHEWSIATTKQGGSNPLNIVDVCRLIKEAKQSSDYVLLVVHGGTEYYNLPTPRMKDSYRFFIEQGVDAVVNHHQHCYSGYEVYHGKPIIYGLGNFCFDKPTPKENKLWEEGYLVELCFDGSITFFLHPYVQCSEQEASVKLLSDRTAFDAELHRLNTIINDDELLQRQFNDLLARCFTIPEIILSPYTSDFSRMLLAKHMLPTFVNKSRLKQLVAYVQCEAHRDILVHVIQNRLSKNKQN